jgi:hypothetical protein
MPRSIPQMSVLGSADTHHASVYSATRCYAKARVPVWWSLGLAQGHSVPDEGYSGNAECAQTHACRQTKIRQVPDMCTHVSVLCSASMMQSLQTLPVSVFHPCLNIHCRSCGVECEHGQRQGQVVPTQPRHAPAHTVTILQHSVPHIWRACRPRRSTARPRDNTEVAPAQPRHAPEHSVTVLQHSVPHIGRACQRRRSSARPRAVPGKWFRHNHGTHLMGTRGRFGSTRCCTFGVRVDAAAAPLVGPPSRTSGSDTTTART